MSDDIGLGLPLAMALFPKESVLLFLLSAIQATAFNTAAFVLMETGRARADMAIGGKARSAGAIVISVLANLRRNLLIVAVAFGLIYRLTVRQPLPWYIDGITEQAGFSSFHYLQPITHPFLSPLYPPPLLTPNQAGNAFTPLVLYLAGCASVGTFGKLAQLPSTILPATLVVLQSSATRPLPTVHKRLVATAPLKFAFVYDTLLPCTTAAPRTIHSISTTHPHSHPQLHPGTESCRRQLCARGRQSHHLPAGLVSTVASYLALNKILAYPCRCSPLSPSHYNYRGHRRHEGSALSDHAEVSILGAAWFFFGGL